jgi:hypothetical protein
VCDGKEEETWGTVEEWQEDLVASLRDDFQLSDLIYHSEAGKQEHADVFLLLRVAPDTPSKPEVEVSAALLDVLAYVTIPLLPIWIRDVRKDPGLRLELTASFVGQSSVDKLEDTIDRELPALVTSLLERSPLFSWTTLGAIVLPPFLFEGDDRSEHMEASMGARVRRLAAATLAPAIRLKLLKSDPKGLVRDIKVSRGPSGTELSFDVHEEVQAVSVHVGKRVARDGDFHDALADLEPCRNKDFALDRKEREPLSCPLLPGAEVARIEVETTDYPQVVRRYTVVLEKDYEEQGS